MPVEPAVTRTTIRVLFIEACRYGGEEFCLLLPDCPPGFAQQRTMGIVNAFGRRRLCHAGAASGPVTSSAGVAAIPITGRRPAT